MFSNIPGAVILATRDNYEDAVEYRDRCIKELKRQGLDKSHRISMVMVTLPNGRHGFRIFYAENKADHPGLEPGTDALTGRSSAN